MVFRVRPIPEPRRPCRTTTIQSDGVRGIASAGLAFPVGACSFFDPLVGFVSPTWPKCSETRRTNFLKMCRHPSKCALPGFHGQLDRQRPEPAADPRIQSISSWSDPVVLSEIPTRLWGPCASLFSVASCSRLAAGNDERGAAKARLVQTLLNHCRWTTSRAENFFSVTGSSNEKYPAACPEELVAYGRSDEDETSLPLQESGSGIAISCPEHNAAEAIGGTATRRVADCNVHEGGGFSDEVRLTADSMGRPILLLGKRRGPAVSFSHLGLKTWAALAVGECAVGIDAACGSEFTGRYPFRRAFHDAELDAVSKEGAVEVADAAAAVWSVKEAAVKALGCGFWKVDPLDVHVGRWTRTGNGFLSMVTLARPGRNRFGRAEALRVWTFSDHGVWVSATVLDSSLI